MKIVSLNNSNFECFPRDVSLFTQNNSLDLKKPKDQYIPETRIFSSRNNMVSCHGSHRQSFSFYASASFSIFKIFLDGVKEHDFECTYISN